MGKSQATTTRTYQIPPILRDLVIHDLVELAGNTVMAATWLNLSQPTVSRRTRLLARDLGLQRRLDRSFHGKYADTDCLRLLRRGANLHRWQAGVLRIGACADAAAMLHSRSPAQVIALDHIQPEHWETLLGRELLDAVVVNGATVLSSTRAAQEALPLSGGRQLICRPHPLIRRLALAMASDGIH